MNEEQSIIVKPDSYSVKTTTDITERIQELTKRTGLNHKDLFAAIVTRYYTELEAGSELDRSDDMQQIRYHLNRAENIFLGSLQKVQDLKKDYSLRLEELKMQHKEVQEKLQQNANHLAQELEKLTKVHSDTENQFKKITDRNRELEESSKGSRLTIELLSQKTAELTFKVGRLESLETELNNLQEKSVSDQQKLNALRSELEKTQQTIANLQQLQLELEDTAHQQGEKLKETYNKDLQQFKEVQKLEIDKVLLESERRALEIAQKVKDDYQAKIDGLRLQNDNLKAINQTLTEKIYGFEMDRLKLENREKQQEKSPT